MDTLGPQSNDSLLMEQQLMYGAISAFEGGISLKLIAVESRDASELIPAPEQFLRVVECECRYGRRERLWPRGWKEQTPDLSNVHSVMYQSEAIENIEVPEAEAPLRVLEMPL